MCVCVSAAQACVPAGAEGVPPMQDSRPATHNQEAPRQPGTGEQHVHVQQRVLSTCVTVHQQRTRHQRVRDSMAQCAGLLATSYVLGACRAHGATGKACMRALWHRQHRVCHTRRRACLCCCTSLQHKAVPRVRATATQEHRQHYGKARGRRTKCWQGEARHNPPPPKKHTHTIIGSSHSRQARAHNSNWLLAA